MQTGGGRRRGAVCGGCHGRIAARHENAEVEALLARMTLDEKIQLLHGAPEPAASNQGEAGYLPGIARLGVGPLRFADGPPGVLTRYPATALTASMGLAATFSRADAHDNGSVIARDARTAGIDVVLEPVIIIHRDTGFFSAYNTFGEDPLLSGAIAASEIEGIQQGGVMAQAKHYVAFDGATDVSVDAQTLHEIYLAPFAAAVEAGVASIMCAYNVVNGSYACGNRDMLVSVLRGELKFQGFITSDWGAVHATTFINDGLDLEMPGSGTVMDSYLAGNLPRTDEPRKPLDPPIINHIPEETLPEPDVPAPRLPGSPPIGLHRGTARRARSRKAPSPMRPRHILTQLQRFGYLDHARPMRFPRAANRLRRPWQPTRPWCVARPSTPRCCSRMMIRRCR